MYAISLTSIPPRLSRLGPVLDALLAQDPAPERVLLCLPRAYRRFAGSVAAPTLPKGAEILWSDTDFGPATKAIVPARHLAAQVDHLIYCDDDWIMPPGWAAALLEGASNGWAAAASGYGVERLKRRAEPGRGDTDIAQGFAGVAISPDWLAGPDIGPPAPAWAVDDIWLSGQLARQGIPVRLAPKAREGMVPAFDDDHALQDTTIDGQSRHEANLACAKLLHDRYGIWPPL